MKNAFSTVSKPFLAILASVALCFFLLTVSGYDAVKAFGALFEASFHNARGFGNMLNKACPLLFAGIAVAFSFRGSVFNLGAEGQFMLGAIASTWVGTTFIHLPGSLLIPFMILSGALAGAIWGFFPGYFKAKQDVPEVITTIMFNYIALHLAGYLVRYPMRDLTQFDPQSASIAQQANLSYLIEGTKLHAGFFIGCMIALIIGIVLFKTYFGYEVRAVGNNAIAAKYGGIKVGPTIIATMLLSGAIAGIGGAVEVSGNAHYLYGTISAGYGYTAIAVSILANNNPIGIIATSMLFGFLSAGSTAMQRAVDVSASFVYIFQGIIIIFVAIAAASISPKRRYLKKKER